MALFRKTFVAGEHARNHARNRVRNNQRRQFAAREHIIADRNLLRLQFFYNTLVHTLIMAAQQRNIIQLCKFFHTLLGKRFALGRKIDQMRPCPCFFAQIHIAVVNGLRLHDHPHAAAVRRIIHPAVLILRVIPDIRAFDLHFARFARSADNACPKIGAAHIRKQRHNINSHQKALSLV